MTVADSPVASETHDTRMTVNARILTALIIGEDMNLPTFEALGILLLVLILLLQFRVPIAIYHNSKCKSRHLSCDNGNQHQPYRCTGTAYTQQDGAPVQNIPGEEFPTRLPDTDGESLQAASNEGAQECAKIRMSSNTGLEDESRSQCSSRSNVSTDVIGLY